MSYISKKNNAYLMKEARFSLKNKWGVSIGVAALSLAISFLIQIPILGAIIFSPLYLGLTYFFLSISRNKEPNLNQLFYPFHNGNLFGTAIGAYCLSFLFIILGIICFVIPGIILSYAFSMIFFIIADDKKIGPLDSVKKSYILMKGNKWKLFCLSCRFIGWYILAIPTLGIGLLWIIPYQATSQAKFYEDIIKNERNN